QSGLNAISAILYPTALRSTGSGSAVGIGRVGAGAGPVVGGWLICMKFPVQDLYMIATVPFIVGAVVAFILMPMFAERMATHGPGRRRLRRLGVIASEGKQSSCACACARGGDCFVALRAPRNDALGAPLRVLDGLP